MTAATGFWADRIREQGGPWLYWNDGLSPDVARRTNRSITLILERGYDEIHESEILGVVEEIYDYDRLSQLLPYVGRITEHGPFEDILDEPGMWRVVR